MDALPVGAEHLAPAAPRSRRAAALQPLVGRDVEALAGVRPRQWSVTDIALYRTTHSAKLRHTTVRAKTMRNTDVRSVSVVLAAVNKISDVSPHRS